MNDSIFFDNQWLWSKFLKYLISNLDEYQCSQYKIPEEFVSKESTFGSKKKIQNAKLATWAVHNERIKIARTVCINSSTYSVLNFLIIPDSVFNFPFLGVDFVSLPNYHLIVLDFQPSINVEKQFNNCLLDRLLYLKNKCHEKLPYAEEMSAETLKFFSPGLIWSKLPKKAESYDLIKNTLYYTFQDYLGLYLNSLFKCTKVDKNLQNEVILGQQNYLNYRKRKDPARPMLKSLFGNIFTESLINNFLFSMK